MIVIVATHTGWPLEYIGRLPYRRLVYMVNGIMSQRRAEAYRIEYRIGQVMCALLNDKTHRHKPEQFVGDMPEISLEVTINMTEVTKTQEVVLGDDKTYLLPVIDANVMEAIEEEFDKTWQELFEKPRIKVLKAVVLQLLKPSNPNITLKEVGALLTVKAQSNVAKVLTKLV